MLGCVFLDEDRIVQNLSFGSVKRHIEKLGGDTKNTGWYLQQFIKLGISLVCEEEFYLVWDSDTIPLNHIDFFDTDGRPFFNLKREYFHSYFQTIERLFGIKKSTKESFISEHMIFKADIVREMISKIEANEKIDGRNFYQKILAASDLLHRDFIKTDQRFFSEFETFGTYCDAFHPKVYAKRRLRTLRHGTDFLGFDPTDEVLEWAAHDFDTISFESWGTPIAETVALSKDERKRREMSFANTIRQFFKNERKRIFEEFPKINHERFRHFFESTIAKTNFDFFFSKKLAYSKRNPYFEDSILQSFHFLYVTKCRIHRYWRLFTFRF